MSEISENVLKLILQKLESQEELLVLLIPDFKTKKGVANFFGVCEKTLDNWKESGKFQEGVEYFINEKGRVEYIPQGLYEHKKNRQNKQNTDKEPKSEKQKIYHPSVMNIVKGLKVG